MTGTVRRRTVTVIANDLLRSGTMRETSPHLGALGALILPALAALVYLSSVLAHGGQLIADLNWSSDVASPMVIGHTLASSGNHGSIVVQQPLYVWLDVLTAHLPAARQVWEAIPLATTIISGALITFVVYQLRGAWSVALAALILLCPPAALLPSMAAQSVHGLTWLAAITLGAFLVRLAHPGSGRYSRQTIVIAVAISIAEGVALASDVTLAAIGVVPFLLAAVLVALVDRNIETRRVAIISAGMGAAICAVAGVVQWLMSRTGFSTGLPGPTLLGVAPLGAVPHHVNLLIHAITDIANGIDPATTQRYPLWGWGLMLVVVSALAALPVLVVRAAVRARSPLHDGFDRGEFAHVAFWCAALAALAGSFLIGKAAVDIGAVRYITLAYYAIAATAPLWIVGRSWRRAAVCVGVSIVVLMGAVNMSTDARLAAMRPANTAGLPSVIQSLSARGLHKGYAGYWNAAAMTWKTNFGIAVYPIREDLACGGGRPRLCVSDFNAVSSWYAPTTERTFVLADRAVSGVTHAPPVVLGSPAEVYAVGVFTVYVYDHDVATAFAAACAPAHGRVC